MTMTLIKLNTSLGMGGGSPLVVLIIILIYSMCQLSNHLCNKQLHQCIIGRWAKSQVKHYPPPPPCPESNITWEFGYIPSTSYLSSYLFLCHLCCPVCRSPAGEQDLYAYTHWTTSLLHRSRLKGKRKALAEDNLQWCLSHSHSQQGIIAIWDTQTLRNHLSEHPKCI